MTFVTLTLQAIAYPALLGKLGQDSLEMDIYDNKTVKKYIDELVGSILNLNGGN